MKRVVIVMAWWLFVGAWGAGSIMANIQNRCGAEVAAKKYTDRQYWVSVLAWPVILVSAVSYWLRVDEVPKPDCRVN